MEEKVSRFCVWFGLGLGCCCGPNGVYVHRSTHRVPIDLPVLSLHTIQTPTPGHRAGRHAARRRPDPLRAGLQLQGTLLHPFK